MMKVIGLFCFLLLSVQTLDAATLMIRGHVPAVYQIEWIDAKAKLSSNLSSNYRRLKPSIIESKKNSERIITIIHP